MKTAAFLTLLAAAGLAAFCFSTDRMVLGGINAALAAINLLTLSRL